MTDIAVEPTIRENSPVDANDAAWASINTPLHPDSLLVFIQDIERLLRINPMLEFKKWDQLSTSHFFMAGRNISQETAFEFETDLHVKQLSNGIEIEYEQGIKSRTTFEVESVELENSEPGSKLTITDYYDRFDEEDGQDKLDKVDKSLVNWATDLQRYVLKWQKWSRFGLWRWYMRRVWQPMKPTARRITYMLLWISVVEVALIALGAALYIAEYR